LANGPAGSGSKGGNLLDPGERCSLFFTSGSTAGAIFDTLKTDRRIQMLQRRLNRKTWAVGVMAMASMLATPVYAQSAADCAARADRAARESSGVLGGAVAGGAGGALFGAIVSDKSSRGARRGAALGAVVGGASGAHNKDQIYKRVYDDCMAGRYR
jgi:hypothetical protein